MDTNPATTASRTFADPDAQRPAVCVIEDDAPIRRLLRELLEDEGCRALEAADGESGLALLRSHAEPLVVLLDYTLPEINGCDLLDLVATDATLRERRVFLMMTATAYKAKAECGDSLDELEVTVFGKPFAVARVLAAVADAAHWLMEGGSSQLYVELENA